ncbi:MAG: VWA domain-containing protein [Verrucomicrobiota bacterium]|nr:VWA domain-containing protein [Verrucomicrobiota bacterium]
MSFAFPWAFLLLPIVLWAVFRDGKKSGTTVASLNQWGSFGSGRTRFLWIQKASEAIFFVGLIFALARPQAGTSETVEEAEGIAIELLVDVSSSMDRSVEVPGEGVKTRMEIAKDLLERFIAGDGERLAGRPNDLIGLVSFARYADTRSPLTFGHEALVQIVRELEIQDRPNEDGTAYGDALTLACARLEKLDELKSLNAGRQLTDIESRIIILLTDGENNSGNHLPLEAAGLAKLWGCRVYSISLGDSNDADDLEPTGGGERYSNAELTLQRISEETGGVFRRATGYESLLSIYGEIDELERTQIETRSFTIVSEWYWAPLLGAAIFLLGGIFLRMTWLRVA